MRKSLILAGAFALLLSVAHAAPPDTTATVPTGQKEIDLTVTVATDPNMAQPLSYQWKKDGVAIAPPTGTAEPFILLNLQPSDSGRYTVTVSNSKGSTDSLNGAVITVQAPQTPPSGAVVQPPSVK